MQSIRIFHAFAALGVALPLALSGCGRTSDAPLAVARDAGSALAVDRAPIIDAATTVDLNVGRVTETHRLFRYRAIPAGGAPGEWITLEANVTASITGTEEHHGLTYAVETLRSDDGTGPSLNAYRQDKSGLYSWQSDLEPTARGASLVSSIASEQTLAERGLADAAVRLATGDASYDAALRAAIEAVRLRHAALTRALGASAGSLPGRVLAGPPGGPGTAEITLLRYPLHPGATWEGRVGFNVWTVEALENLLTDAGRFSTARVRIDIPSYLGPEDHYQAWWGAPGDLQSVFHTEEEIVDGDGNVLGLTEWDEFRTLVSYTPGS